MKSARRTLRIDGLFELLLAGLILAPSAAGVDLEDAFGIEGWIVFAVGVALIAVGVGILLAKPDRPTVLALGVANAAGAVLFAVYLAIQGGEMNGFGVAVTVFAIAGLVVLAAAELRLWRRGRGGRSSRREGW